MYATASPVESNRLISRAWALRDTSTASTNRSRIKMVRMVNPLKCQPVKHTHNQASVVDVGQWIEDVGSWWVIIIVSFTDIFCMIAIRFGWSKFFQNLFSQYITLYLKVFNYAFVCFQLNVFLAWLFIYLILSINGLRFKRVLERRLALILTRMARSSK